MERSDQVAIVGGGIGGLTAALALLRHGIDVTVYEQATELKELGAGVQISPNGTKVLYSLGLGPEIENVGVVVAGKEIRLWSTGQIWNLFDLGAECVERYGSPFMMFHRGDLHAALLDGIRAANPHAIHLNRKCAGISQTADGVSIQFENGEMATASLAIGADGVQSRVRLAVFGADRPEFTGIVCWRVLVPRTKDQAGPVSTRLRGYGAVPEEVPTISVEPPRNPLQMDKAVRGLVEGRYEWIAFTSVNAVKAVREKFEEYGLDARAFSGLKIAAVGDKTAQAIADWGLRADLVPSGEQSAAGLLEDWPEYDEQLDPINRVFLPRADIATENLVAGLKIGRAHV